MEVKFYTDDKVLDLTGRKITVQDSNSAMNDRMFTKYTFPFDIYMGEEFLRSFGDYRSHESRDLQNKFSGTLLFENRLHQAKLIFGEVEGQMITCQIDFGFEELPNYDKKLAELPLHKFAVADIHTYATQVATLKYPATDFNFPRAYTSKYPPDQEVWDAFDGYYNDLKADGSEMRRNYIDEMGNIFNINIIHPMPHLLYLLKTGFADAGFTLAGDVLSDPIFEQRWVFSGTEYFTSKQQRRYGFKFTSANYDQLFLENGPDDYCEYDKYNTIEKPGRYKIAGALGFFKARKMFANYWITLNGKAIWQRYHGPDNQTIFESIPFNMEIDVTQPDSILRLYIYTQYHEDSWTHEIANLQITSNVLEDIANTTLGDDTGFITNLNEIDLTRAVPNITFGELINRMRNRFNYGLLLEGNTIYMNRLGKDPENVKDFQALEIENPRKKLLDDRSFLLSSADLNDGPQPSIFYDKTGAVLNKAALKDTIVIESNVVIVQTGVPKPQGYDTAIIKKDGDDALQLIWYDGLTGVQNNAKNPAGAEYPELFYSHWEKWLRQRTRGFEYTWKSYCPAEQFSWRITDHVFAFNNIHNIKTWTKDLSDGVYEVEIVTESI